MTALPTALYTAAQTRELDRLAIAAGTPGAALMQRAGQAAFNALCERWPEARHIAVLCGGGNNGGDGYVVAALAHDAGLQPRIHFLKSPDSLSGDALTMAERCRALHIPMQPLSVEALPVQADVLVDGLFGTGLSASLSDEAARVLTALDALIVPRLALDIPSGLSADTGMPLGAVLRADLTCTFIGLKRGLLTGQGPVYTGELQFADLQVPRDVYQQVPADCLVPTPTALLASLPPRRLDGHKGRYGHVLVIGGDHGFAGAPIMSAQAAARCGAGKVSLITRPEHVVMMIARQPEVMARGVNEPAQAQSLIEAATVIAVGPGLGRDDWGKGLLELAMSSGKPLVMDADALNLLADMDNVGAADWVLTPHPGEAARLLKADSAAIQHDRFATLESLHARYGGTVLLKGLGTLVQGDAGRALITEGNPGMASGGMGDVLTGVVAALRAQGLSGYDAARFGAMLHARAADSCARDKGELGLLATDLLEALRLNLKIESLKVERN
ncbi:NAD(P)H-hydrate dehydratase [Alcanivorax sediminis]|uniref:Bifunctional NAD(P)H-hydrate repair enzyme n=1 Tax=Alcanivorax sediminis TaxID=2663008 RepID=A0A6N7LR20_9GAMM|nr:NAD(P)H-hydrate dehydratase [Alcanivorax sediminis]MQX52797.1 NAD(P)H-hydrate dehydratase [Alcanivorax sediminis]